MNIDTRNQNEIFDLKELMTCLLERPERTTRAFVQNTDSPFVAYQAGQEAGYEWGHEAGFGKGVATGLLAIAGLAATAWLWSRLKS